MPSEFEDLLQSVLPWNQHRLELIEAALGNLERATPLRQLMNGDGRSIQTTVELAHRSEAPHLSILSSLEFFTQNLGEARMAWYGLITTLTELFHESSQKGHSCAQLLRHAVASAELSRSIAPQFGASPFETSALALFCQLDRMLLATKAPRDFDRYVALMRDGVSVEEAEHKAFGGSTEGLSVQIAMRMRFPSVLCGLMAALEDYSREPIPEVKALLKARLMANRTGFAAVGGVGMQSKFAIPDHPSLTPGLARVAVQSVKALDNVNVPSHASSQPRVNPVEADLRKRVARLSIAYERTKKHLEERESETGSLVATFASMTMGLDGDALQYSLLESLLENYGASTSFLLSSDDGSGKLKGSVFSMEESGAPQAMPMRLDIALFARETREALLSGSAVTVFEGPSADVLRNAVGVCNYYLVAPMMNRGSWSGILGIGLMGAQQESSAKVEFLSILATASALGLENARLYAEVLHQATVDPLTLVATRRAVVGELERLAKRAACDRGPFGVLLIDLDYFKAVNDTMGHQAGDRYLKEMASAMQVPLRDSDLIGRYGGDEFVVILRDVDLEQTQEIAEEIRRSTETIAMGPSWAEVLEPLGASIGVTWWDGEPIEAAALLAMADSSLYLGKAEGRNAVGFAAVRETF